MKKSAITYIASVLVIGLGLLAHDLSQWKSESVARLLLYVVITWMGSLLKVRLPGITGTMSVYFMFLLVGLTELSLAEVLVVGLGAVVLQCYWHARQRPKPVQLSFNLASTTIAIHCSYMVFHWNLLQGRDLGLPVQIASASLVFFTVNTGTVAGVVGLTERKSIYEIWRGCYFWCFPYYLLGAALAGGFHYLSNAIGWASALLLLPVIYVVYWSYRLYLDKLEGEKTHVEQVAALHLRTIEALALAIDAKDHTTHEHLERVQVFAMELGRELGLNKQELEALEAAALLHDIGKLAVPEHIISKPGKLTPEEFEKMKIHPIIGAEIIETVQFPYPVAPIVQAHHEKWDGSGYPHGLKGTEIPIGARILSIVDCLDALASDRPYRRAIPLEAAVEHVSRESGTSFDPKVVAVLKRQYRNYEAKVVSKRQVPVLAPLSHAAKVERGKAPDAGFETSAQNRGISKNEASEFLGCIASARQEAQTLFELAQTLGSSLSLQDTLSMMAGRLSKLVPYDAVAVYLASDGVLRPEYVLGVDARLLSSLAIPIGEGLSGWVAHNRTAILNGTPSVEAGYLNDPTILCNLNSALSVPLADQHKLSGVLTLYRTERDAFSRDELRVLQAIASKLTMSVENARRFEQAESSATIDYLTGLPNARSLFLRLDSEIKRCTRSKESLAILVCDLDNFKQVNDRFGHLAGNKVLQEIATELEQSLRSHDYVARMGGDEFVILLPNLPPTRVAAKIEHLNTMVSAICQRVCGVGLVSMSAGVAKLGTDGERAEDLLAVADRRMYESKSGANRVRSMMSLSAEFGDGELENTATPARVM